MSEIGYAVESDFIDRTELTMKPGILVLTGLNATMKSVAARTFLIAGPEDVVSIIKYEPNFIRMGAKVHFTEKHAEIVSKARRLWVSDSRIVTRAMLYAYKWFISRALSSLQDAERMIPEEESALYFIRRARIFFKMALKYLGLHFVESVYREKARASPRIIIEIYKELDTIAKEVVDELGEVFHDVDQAKSAIIPLSIVIDDPKDLRLHIQDTRFGKVIVSEYVSTSVIAPLLFDLVTAFLSQPVGGEEQGYGIIVIEEPEESMTPLQQVVFARYLERAVKKSRELTGCETYVIVTTHSPYIAFAFSKEVPVKYFGFDFSRGKIVVEDKPFKSFAMADVILAAYATRGES